MLMIPIPPLFLQVLFRLSLKGEILYTTVSCIQTTIMHLGIQRNLVALVNR